MLDYGVDKDTAKNFILNFYEDGDSIKINFANGDKDYTVDNTKENRDKLLEQMKNQFDYYHYDSKLEKKKKNSIFWLIYDIIFLGVNVSMMFIGPTVWNIVASSFFVLGGACQIYELASTKKKLKDLEKHKLFIHNEQRINEYLNKGNEEVNERTINIVKSDEKDSVLNINDVHDMELDDVKKILDDIDRDERLNIDRPKVLQKKYIKASSNDLK